MRDAISSSVGVLPVTAPMRAGKRVGVRGGRLRIGGHLAQEGEHGILSAADLPDRIWHPVAGTGEGRVEHRPGVPVREARLPAGERRGRRTEEPRQRGDHGRRSRVRFGAGSAGDGIALQVGQQPPFALAGRSAAIAGGLRIVHGPSVDLDAHAVGAGRLRGLVAERDLAAAAEVEQRSQERGPRGAAVDDRRGRGRHAVRRSGQQDRRIVRVLRVASPRLPAQDRPAGDDGKGRHSRGDLLHAFLQSRRARRRSPDRMPPGSSGVVGMRSRPTNQRRSSVSTARTRRFRSGDGSEVQFSGTPPRRRLPLSVR